MDPTIRAPCDAYISWIECLHGQAGKTTRRVRIDGTPARRPIREAEGTDLPERVYTDLDALAGSWVDVPGFDDAIQAPDRVDQA
jgi:hypothetical protein